MKKISKLAGFVAAAALLCGISGCDNTETITMTTTKIEMVGDPIVTGKAVIFQWKDSGTNDKIVITRQASGEEEITIAEPSSNVFTDRVTYENLLEAGVEYTYRFYNKIDFSSGRTTEYTLEKKYSCVERKVTFPSIAAAGTKLAPFTDDQIKIDYSEENGKNYVSIYVDEKESGVFIDIEDKTNEITYYNIHKEEMGGVKAFEYDSHHDYEIRVAKWWPKNATYTYGYYDDDYDSWREGGVQTDYYDTSDTTKTFDLAATKSNIYISLKIEPWNDNFEVSWNGKKDCTYEVSFEAFDNQEKAVALKKSTIANTAIKKDAFFNCLATGKLSDFITFDATTNKTSVKTVKATVKETAKDGTVSEGEKEREIDAYSTKYTQLNRNYWDNKIADLEVIPQNVVDGNTSYISARVTLGGANLPDTAKLYYKHSGEALYTEIAGGLKKVGGQLTVLLAKDVLENGSYYDFKAVVTVDDNAKWYNWEEDKTEEVATKYSVQAYPYY